MRSISLLVGTIVLLASSALAQITGDVLGQHQMSPGSGSSVIGGGAGCLYCHAPHSGLGGATPLWNQTLSKASYIPYASSTSSSYHQQGQVNPTIGSDSSLCLSCHDGTVAPGSSLAYGNMTMFGTMNKTDLVGAADISGQHPLQPQHPFSLTLPIVDSPDLAASLALQAKTNDPTGTVSLVKGNLECTSCHDPHVQNKDLISLNFLVRDSSGGTLCLSCHDPKRTYSNQGNPVLWQKNPLSNWTTSIHAMATNQVATAANVGTYSTVAKNACISCHAPHNAPGPTRLTRAANELDCLVCHSGGTNVSPAAPNILNEYTTPGNVAHPLPQSQGNNQHNKYPELEDLISKNVVLNGNRHATCVDCHNAHSANQVATFANLMPPAIRVSQAGISGVSADGVTIMNPAANQYENCLRCHGPSTGKTANIIYGYLPMRAAAATDSLNVIFEFASTAASSHPVINPAGTGALAQPTLLTNMWQLNGTTQGRSMGSQIFCTDCHNAADNREFGGSGPNGPHGSKYSHILERAYPFTQAPAPGQTIAGNFLYPTPDLSPIGTYALCAKCHDLTKLNQSWAQHFSHINQGFSCSVCHTAHGMGAASGNISGQRLVNFDANVVAQNGTTPITYSYNGGSDSCTLTCHNYSHKGSGAPTANASKGPVNTKAK